MYDHKAEFEKLAKIEVKIKDLAKGVSTMQAPAMMRDFILGYDVANTMLAKAIKEDMRATNKLKEAEGIAYYDEAPHYLAEKGVKDSSEARKKYLPLDANVQEAQEKKQKTEALVGLLKGKVQTMRMAHDAVKKMAYSSDYANNSPFEGL